MAQVTIEVDEKMFADVINKELEALPKEKIQDIIVESIGEYLRSNNYENIERLFIDIKDRYGYKDVYAKPVMEKLVAGCDYSKLQDVVDAAIDSLKADYNKILIDTISECIVRGMTDHYGFRQAVEDSVRSIIAQNNNNSYM